MRQPLMEDALLPTLLPTYNRDEPNAARWLAALPHTANLHRFDLHIDTLLKSALRRDPSDDLARQALIRRYAWLFDYSLHELPSGVLYGWDGATVEQCAELLSDLAQMRLLLTIDNLTNQYQDRLTRWQFHFSGYADYLQHRGSYQNYADYIARHLPASDVTD